MKVARLDPKAQLKTLGTLALSAFPEIALEMQPYLAAKVQETYA